MITGCASNSIVGDELAHQDDWFGDLGITGHVNKVTVQGDSRLTRLSIIGDANTVVVDDGATLGKIEIFGENNSISVPAGLVVRESILGKGNEIIRRPETWKLAADKAPESPSTSE